MLTSRSSKGTLLAISVCFSFLATLAFTPIVFAGGDTSEHNKSHSHNHRTSARSTNDEVQWTVEVGKIDWNGVSTYVWHKVVARNNGQNRITGDWEWNHEVTGTGDNDFDAHDTTFRTFSFSARRRGDQQLTKQGYSSVDLPGAGTYRLTAYTEVTMYRGNTELTKPPPGQSRKNKRSIKSIEFRVL